MSHHSTARVLCSLSMIPVILDSLISLSFSQPLPVPRTLLIRQYPRALYRAPAMMAPPLVLLLFPTLMGQGFPVVLSEVATAAGNAPGAHPGRGKPGLRGSRFRWLWVGVWSQLCSRGSPLRLGSLRESGRGGANPGGAGRGPVSAGVGSWRGWGRASQLCSRRWPLQ